VLDNNRQGYVNLDQGEGLPDLVKMGLIFPLVLGKGIVGIFTHKCGVQVILGGRSVTVLVSLSSLDFPKLSATQRGRAEYKDVRDLDVSFKLSPT